jgi:hypothetical protein
MQHSVRLGKRLLPSREIGTMWSIVNGTGFLVSLEVKIHWIL